MIDKTDDPGPAGKTAPKKQPAPDGPAPAAVDPVIAAFESGAPADDGPAPAEVSTRPDYRRGDQVVRIEEPAGPPARVRNMRHGNRGIYEIQIEGAANWVPAAAYRKA